jgi:hypothetical protein
MFGSPTRFSPQQVHFQELVDIRGATEKVKEVEEPATTRSNEDAGIAVSSNPLLSNLEKTNEESKLTQQQTFSDRRYPIIIESRISNDGREWRITPSQVRSLNYQAPALRNSSPEVYKPSQTNKQEMLYTAIQKTTPAGSRQVTQRHTATFQDESS